MFPFIKRTANGFGMQINYMISVRGKHYLVIGQNINYQTKNSTTLKTYPVVHHRM